MLIVTKTSTPQRQIARRRGIGSLRSQGRHRYSPSHLRLFPQNPPALCPIAGSRFPPNKKIWEEIVTRLSNLPDPRAQASGFDRRNLIKGASALAATAVTMKAASSATVTPFGQTGAPTPPTDPLPLGPPPRSRYPASHLQ